MRTVPHTPAAGASPRPETAHATAVSPSRDRAVTAFSGLHRRPTFTNNDGNRLLLENGMCHSGKGDMPWCCPASASSALGNDDPSSVPKGDSAADCFRRPERSVRTRHSMRYPFRCRSVRLSHAPARVTACRYLCRCRSVRRDARADSCAGSLRLATATSAPATGSGRPPVSWLPPPDARANGSAHGFPTAAQVFNALSCT